MNKVLADKKIEVSAREYNLLKEAYKQIKRQGVLLRIFEAEESLEKGKIKSLPSQEFIERI